MLGEFSLWQVPLCHAPHMPGLEHGGKGQRECVSPERHEVV
jgi:hypothetical protein